MTGRKRWPEEISKQIHGLRVVRSRWGQRESERERERERCTEAKMEKEREREIPAAVGPKRSRAKRERRN